MIDGIRQDISSLDVIKAHGWFYGCHRGGIEYDFNYCDNSDGHRNEKVGDYDAWRADGSMAYYEFTFPGTLLRKEAKHGGKNIFLHFATLTIIL